MRKEPVHMVVLYLKSNGYFYILLKYYDIITLNPLTKLNQFNQNFFLHHQIQGKGYTHKDPNIDYIELLH